jgi:hypothetical protein
MSAFNADDDDLNEFFYCSFVESWAYNSSDKEEGIEFIKELRDCLGMVDKFTDWIMEQLELNYSSDKYFRKAVLNTLDVEGLMKRLNEWAFERTCEVCYRCMDYCECEECGEE